MLRERLAGAHGRAERTRAALEHSEQADAVSVTTMRLTPGCVGFLSARSLTGLPEVRARR